MILAIGFSTRVQGQTAAPAKSRIPPSLKSQARIPVEVARAAANVQGVIKEEDLEKQNGKLVYTSDIQATGESDMTEVQASGVAGSIEPGQTN